MHYLKKVFCATNTTTIILLISIVCSVFLSLRYINISLWQDELYSLEHFVFVPIGNSFFDYHKANNHILFNALLNLYCKGLRLSFQDVLYQPWLIRMLPFSYYLLNIGLLYTLCKKLFNTQMASIITSVFVTTLALINFSCQMRGYSLSGLLCTVQVLVFMQNITANPLSSIKKLSLLVGMSILMVLCLPSNIYIIGAELIVCVVVLCSQITMRSCFSPIQKKTFINLMIALAVSAVVVCCYYAILYYYHNPEEIHYPTNHFSAKNFYQLFASVFHFTHTRIHLYVVLLVFLIAYVLRRNKAIPYRTILTYTCAMYGIFFIFYWMHGAIVMPRLLVSLIPLFAIVVGICLYAIISAKQQPSRLANLFMTLNILLFIGGAFWNIHRSSINNIASKHTQNLVEHYYLNCYNPMSVCKLTQTQQLQNNIPVLLLDDYGGTGLSYYLNNLNINYTHLNTEQKLLLGSKSCFIITNNTLKLTHFLQQQGVAFKPLFANYFYYNVYSCVLP